jgi:cystathionine beta-lyase
MNDSSQDGRSPPPARRPATRVVTAGRDPKSYHGFVNPPVYHASTMLYPSAEDFLAHRARYQYGRRGTPTTEALELALQEIEGGNCAGVSLLPSGLAAISTALLSVVQAGDHVLVTDSAYGPTRNYCEGILKRLGVTTSYFDPLIGGGIAEQFRPNTRAVFVESPGSLTFEMQDVTATAKVAHDKGATVLMDNTWATPLFYRALDFGVDLSIQAGTKYIGGHSDLMLGTVSANSATVASLKNTVRLSGLCEGPDDVYLGLRGLRTLAVRLDRHYASGVRCGALAGAAAGSVAHTAPGAGKPSGSRTVEARFHRRFGPVQRGAQAGAAAGGVCFPRYARIVRHRRVVGRF